MPTENPRIQVMLDHETNGLLADLAATRHCSLSAVAADLIREALELEEDRVLSAHGASRLATTREWISHDEAWS